MEAAKNTLKQFVAKAGHHDTTVDEDVRPAVTNETVKPHRHEEATEAVDREVHQHHYHTTVQPVTHKETLPEQHKHQQLPVQEREFTHGDSSKIKQGVETEAAKFADTSRTHQTTHTASQGAAVTGEHVHHHVHETVQPVIHKETVQPEVVHTTVPIHETHHAQAEHHGLSTLPTKTLDEFKSLGGSVVGGSHRHEEYEGHPRPYNPAMQAGRSAADTDPKSHDGIHHPHGSAATGAATGAAAGAAAGATGHHHQHGHHNTTGTTGTPGATGTTGGLTGTSRSNVSGLGNDSSTGTGYAGSSGPTGTALGGRSEGNTTDRALHATEAGHGSHGAGAAAAAAGAAGVASSHNHGHHGHHSDVADTTGTSRDTTGRGLDHTTSSTGGAATHSTSRDHANNSASNTSNTGNTTDSTGGAVGQDVQTPRQGKDPQLVEGKSSGKWTGDGVDGSHSAVFGLTPDGHKYDDTAHRTTPLRAAHGRDSDDTSAGTASRGAAGGAVAEQLNDPRVAEKGHGGHTTSTGTTKPGAGAPGGEQGFGKVRPEQHGAEEKLVNKLDPRTDADHDGKRGIAD